MRRNRLHLSALYFFLVVAPTHLRLAIAQRNHGDAVVHRANQRAEIATDTIFFTHLGDRLAGDTARTEDRKSTRLNSSHRCISYAVFCLKKKKKTNQNTHR